jgi:hypothetical protein
MYILKLQKSKNKNLYTQIKKNYKQTNNYIHLSYNERVDCIRELADQINKFTFIRIFAECIDKTFWDVSRTPLSVDEHAFEQVVTRFETYIQIISTNPKYKGEKYYGLLIHDNNETVAKKHTRMMKEFLYHGTFWRTIEKIIETPLFVNSELTCMIQIADILCYALRRYLEYGETDLIDRFKSRFDKRKNEIVGVHHLAPQNCGCLICKNTL